MKFIYVATSCDNSRAVLDEDLLRLRKNLYDPLRSHLPAAEQLVSRAGLPFNTLQEAATRIAAAIITNIQQHYYKRQWQYIALRDGLSKRDAKAKQKQINAAADAGAAAAKAAGQQSYQTHDNSLPFELLESTVALELAKHPERFLFTMWCMNKLREEKGKRLFAVMPMARGFILVLVCTLTQHR